MNVFFPCRIFRLPKDITYQNDIATRYYVHIFALDSRKNYENVNQIITTERMLIGYTTINFFVLYLHKCICIHSYFVGLEQCVIFDIQEILKCSFTFHTFLKIFWYFVLLFPGRFINPGVAAIITIFRMFFQIIK